MYRNIVNIEYNIGCHALMKYRCDSCEEMKEGNLKIRPYGMKLYVEQEQTI
jgi:hypothetical protein